MTKSRTRNQVNLYRTCFHNRRSSALADNRILGGDRKANGDAVSAATNSQADAALELGVLQVIAARPGGGGHRLLRLRVVAAVGGHPPSLPTWISPGRRGEEERSGGTVREETRTVVEGVGRGPRNRTSLVAQDKRTQITDPGECWVPVPLVWCAGPNPV